MPGSAQVDAIPIAAGDKTALAGLMRDYLDEMSAYIGGKPLPAYPLLDLYWSEPDERWPLWIRAGARNIGFALVRRTDGIGRFEMAEFFIARPHRRRHLGLIAARRLIAARPGPWRITQLEKNAAAIAFWHRVLDGFVAYDETTTATDAVRREQAFSVAERTRAG